jgi:hypothetical protein
MAIREPQSSSFSDALAKCQNKCSAVVQDSCFQRDGTRHISMFTGKLTDQQARGLKASFLFKPVTIEIEGWMPWKAGCYLKLKKDSTEKLKSLLNKIEGLPEYGGKRSCDHLSLYRNREANGYAHFARVRAVSHQWGSVQGVSIRIKAVGTDYKECHVLAGV